MAKKKTATWPEFPPVKVPPVEDRFPTYSALARVGTMDPGDPFGDRKWMEEQRRKGRR